MNIKPVNNSKNDTKTKPQTTVKYPELNDSELEVICGGIPILCKDVWLGESFDKKAKMNLLRDWSSLTAKVHDDVIFYKQ